MCSRRAYRTTSRSSWAADEGLGLHCVGLAQGAVRDVHLVAQGGQRGLEPCALGLQLGCVLLEAFPTGHQSSAHLLCRRKLRLQPRRRRLEPSDTPEKAGPSFCLALGGSSSVEPSLEGVDPLLHLVPPAECDLDLF